MALATPAGATASFDVARTADGLRVNGRDYDLPVLSHPAFVALFSRLADDLDLRAPLAAEAPPPAAADAPRLTPVLTESVDARILYGYGDPCVTAVGPTDWRLLVTSNDAPNAFPILASQDLVSWRLQGFVFPAGQPPAWALTGPEVSDFWAPELHQIGREWWVCFTARDKAGALAIGLARSASPDGPFLADPDPVVSGGVIDAHLVLDAAEQPWLVWKQDDNDRWPRALAALLHAEPALTTTLFPDARDARTAAFAAALWPWAATLAPMAQFFALQLLIEAAVEDLPAFAARLTAAAAALPPAAAGQAATVLTALRTRIWAQPIAPATRQLTGQPTVILQNDRPWEGHLIEGVWIAREAGRYHLLYAGNDFSTARYAVGLAVADQVTGPYRKRDTALLRSDAEWWGPGHPSVARGPDGRSHLFLHGFRPGHAGYKAFRALLTTPLSFADGELALG
jgi:arabinan endo-1,5-alpha-L-arabinosidase